MKTVITYGTFDLLHYGHIRLLERAKALGDRLIVGVTSEDFDKQRGKINVQQSLTERIRAVEELGLADEIIVEEYEGQKIDDIRRYHADIFAIGSDWKGKFDYLKEYCEVVYLDRTEGVSSTELRSEKTVRLGLVGASNNVEKVKREAAFVNGLLVTETWDEKEPLQAFLSRVDAVYVYSHPKRHEAEIRTALTEKKHVLVETPVTLSKETTEELFALAEKEGVVLMEALKTAFSTAYRRLILLLKGGKIGEIVSVDAVATSTEDYTKETKETLAEKWGSFEDWGPTGLLPVFDLLGTHPDSVRLFSKMHPAAERFDLFTKAEFSYPNAVASVKVGKGVKAEGELIVSGTKGYAFVPAPWWKTEFFEIRYEDQNRNERFFYRMDGEGIRYELVEFLKAVTKAGVHLEIDREVTGAISGMMEAFTNGEGLTVI